MLMMMMSIVLLHLLLPTFAAVHHYSVIQIAFSQFSFHFTHAYQMRLSSVAVLRAVLSLRLMDDGKNFFIVFFQQRTFFWM
jgi:hypothetical protein